MRILMLHQHFKLPEEGGGIRSYHIAKALALAGHQVDIMSGGNHAGKVSLASNVTVKYLQVSYKNEFSFLRRFFSFISFYAKSKYQLGKSSPYDLVYAISTPLSVGWLGLQLKRKWNCQLIFEVGDLWPLAPIQMGIISNSWLARIFYAREKEIYQHSDAIISLSPDITSYIRKIEPALPVHTITNLSDTSFFAEAIKEVLGEKFTIGYFGAFGLANHLEFLLDAAVECKKQQLPVEFILMGEGMRLAHIKQRAEEADLNEITFVLAGNKLEVLAQMKKCDAIYISFKDLPVLATGSPNKFFDGIAAGKIIICNFRGWLGEEIEIHNIGFNYDPNVPEQFCSRINYYLSNPEAINAARNAALKLANQKYNLQRLTNEVVKLVEKLGN